VVVPAGGSGIRSQSEPGTGCHVAALPGVVSVTSSWRGKPWRIPNWICVTASSAISSPGAEVVRSCVLVRDSSHPKDQFWLDDALPTRRMKARAMSAENTSPVPPEPIATATAAEFGQRLQALMRAGGRSVDNVARGSRDAGTPISRATVYNLIAGTGTPRRDSLVAFLRGCGLPPREQIRWLIAFDRVYASPLQGVPPRDAHSDSDARTEPGQRPGALGSAA
jgi:Helix-turn-helix domain